MINVVFNANLISLKNIDLKKNVEHVKKKKITRHKVESP